MAGPTCQTFPGKSRLKRCERAASGLALRVADASEESGFATVALVTLAIGIGANAAIFSFVNGVLLKALSYGEPERIVRVLEKPPGGGRNGISTLNYLDWQKDNTVFEYMAAQAGGSVTLTGINEPVLAPQGSEAATKEAGQKAGSQ